MTSRSLRHRAPLLWLVLPLMAGLAAGRMGELAAPRALLAGAVTSALLALLAAWRAPRVWAVPLGAAMLLLGWAGLTMHRQRPPGWDELPPREARLSLRIDRVFAGTGAERAGGLATVVRADEHLRDLTGQRVCFSFTLRAGEVAPVRSAELAAVGVLTVVPLDPAAGTFEDYLAGAGVNFRLTRGRVLAQERAASAYHRFCARAAERFNVILGLGLAERRPELAGLLRAMMLGETQVLSEEQHGLFMRSGTMHLFAISGMNIAVIAGALAVLLRWLRLPGWARFAAGAGALWLFVDITGASPSAVRAWVMVVFLQAAWLLWRPANPLAAVSASALAVLLAAPPQFFSASFQMSYGIVAALLLMGLPLGEAWLARWTPWRDLPEATWGPRHRAVSAAWRWTAQAVAIGVATTLMSLLTGVRFFQLLTPGALAANLAIIPAAGLATLGGFVSLLCGLAGFGPGAALCNNVAGLTLGSIEGIVRLSVRLPAAFVSARFRAEWVGPAALLTLLIALLAGYAWGWRKERGGFWPPVAVVAVTLIFGVRFGVEQNPEPKKSGSGVLQWDGPARQQGAHSPPAPENPDRPHFLS